MSDHDRHRAEALSVIQPGKVGIIVACDPKIEHIEMMLDQQLQPVAVLFRGKGQLEIRYPTREVSEEEAVAIVNKYLSEGRLKFGFQQVRPGHPGGGRHLSLG